MKKKKTSDIIYSFICVSLNSHKVTFGYFCQTIRYILEKKNIFVSGSSKLLK